MTRIIVTTRGTKETIRRLTRLGERGADVRGAGPRLLQEVTEVERAIFSSQGRRGGGSWEHLKPSTIKKKGHSTILLHTGRLRDSMTIPKNPDQIFRVTADGFIFGSRVPWAGAHDRGEGGMPRREFTKFDYPDRARFSAILAGWIVERGNRRIALRRLG